MDAQERIQKALDALVYLPHLKQQSSAQAAGIASANGSGKGRVWDRGDLLRRLQTFRPRTWFGKPAPVSPTECARRGWQNTASDEITCEVCLGGCIWNAPAIIQSQKHIKRLKGPC